MAIVPTPRKKWPKQPVSRILYPEPVTRFRLTIIQLWTPVARRLMQPTRELRRAAFKRSPIWSCTRWGLPSFFDHPKNGALLPHHFTLTKLFSPYAICAKSERAWRYIFCCTFLHVTTTPRYGAPCPVVFGLSSGPCWIRRSSVLLRPCINQICFQYMIR